jgi:hypothetical protein
LDTLVIKNARLKYLLFLVLAAGFVAGGIFMLTHGETARQRWTGWATIAFFGAGVPLFAWQLVDARPRLVIDHRGILDRTLGVGVLPWSEITGAYLRSIHGNDFICLEMRNPDMWLGQLSPIKRAMVSANKALGFTELNVNLSGVAADSAHVLELVLKKSAEVGRRPA